LILPSVRHMESPCSWAIWVKPVNLASVASPPELLTAYEQSINASHKHLPR